MNTLPDSFSQAPSRRFFQVFDFFFSGLGGQKGHPGGIGGRSQPRVFSDLASKVPACLRPRNPEIQIQNIKAKSKKDQFVNTQPIKAHANKTPKDHTTQSKEILSHTLNNPAPRNHNVSTAQTPTQKRK